MSIVGEIKELDEIEKGIKRLGSTLRGLRVRKKHLEGVITDFLQRHNEPGVKFQGKAIIAQKKDKRVRKKKSEREEALKNVLSRYVTDPDRVAGEVQEAIQGEQHETMSLKIKNIKSKRR